MDLAGLAVEESWRANDFPAEGSTNGLVTEANSENRKLPCQALNDLHGDAGFLRRARAGRDHNAFGLAASNLFDRDSVVAMDFDVATEFAKILREVVGK